MWEYRRILSLPPGQWGLWAGVAALLPYVGVLWWVRARFDHPGVWLAAAAFWLAFVAIRMVAAAWYTGTSRWHGGWVVWLAGADLLQVNPWRALWIGVWDWPTGILLGWAASVSGLFGTPPGGWWWMVALGVPAAQAVLLAGTAWLYTWFIVSMSQPLQVKSESEEDGRTVLVEMPPSRVRTVFGTLTYAWVTIGSLSVILLLMLGLAVLAHEVPAGYFGLGVALFVGFAMAVVGFPVAVIFGLWLQLLAWLYRRLAAWSWSRIRWREERREVPVS
jgi:hypothetical protein